MAHRKHTRADDRAVLRKRAKSDKRQTTRRKPAALGGPIAKNYVALVSVPHGEGRVSAIQETDKRLALRDAKRLVRHLFDGVVPPVRVTIDLHAESETGTILQQFETYTNEGSGYIRFRALEV